MMRMKRLVVHEGTDDNLDNRPCPHGQKITIRFGHWPPYTERRWCVRGLEFLGGPERFLHKVPSWEHGKGESWCVLRLEGRTKYDLYAAPDPYVVVKWVWGEDHVSVAALFYYQSAAEDFATVMADRSAGEIRGRIE